MPDFVATLTDLNSIFFSVIELKVTSGSESSHM